MSFELDEVESEVTEERVRELAVEISDVIEAKGLSDAEIVYALSGLLGAACASFDLSCDDAITCVRTAHTAVSESMLFLGTGSKELALA